MNYYIFPSQNNCPEPKSPWAEPWLRFSWVCPCFCVNFVCSFSSDAGPNPSVPSPVHCFLSLFSCLPPCHVAVWLCGWLLCCLKCRGMAFLLSGQLLDLQCECPGVFSFLNLIKLAPHTSIWVYSYTFFYSYLILLRMRLWTPQGAFRSPISSGDHEGTSSNTGDIITVTSVCSLHCVACSCHACVLHRFSRGRTDLAHFQRYGLCVHFRLSKEFPKVIEIVLPTLFFLLLENT